MKTLSKETQQLLYDNGISCGFDPSWGEYILHFPTDNFDTCKTESEIVESVNHYVNFWNNINV